MTQVTPAGAGAAGSPMAQAGQAGQGGSSGSSGQGGNGPAGAAGQAGAGGAELGPCIAKYKQTKTVHWDPPPKDFACDLPKPCGDVWFSSEAPGTMDYTQTTTGPLAFELHEDATQCVLEALRDGKVGQYWINWAAGGSGDYEHHIFARVYSLGGGVVIYEANDIYGGYHYGFIQTRRLRLKDASYFDECLARTDPTQRALCVTGTDTSADLLPEKNGGFPPWSTGTCDDLPPSCPAP